MTVENPVRGAAGAGTTGRGPAGTPDEAAEAATVRDLVRQATAATLATLDRATGTAYASLVQMATLPDATPVLLLSDLARHTRNAEADPRASLLVDRREAGGDLLTGGRATLIGRLRRCDRALAARRYLARYPDAADYAGFADFAVWTLDIEAAHLVAGFGRIRALPAAGLRLDGDGDVAARVARLAEQEAEILAWLEAERANAPAEATGWQVTGLDLDGIDLLRGSDRVRLRLPADPASSVAWPGELEATLSTVRRALRHETGSLVQHGEEKPKQ